MIYYDRIKKEGDKEIKGRAFPAIIHNGRYFLTEIVVYEDGLIDCWRPPATVNEFQKLLDEGWVRLDVPENSVVDVHNLGLMGVVKLIPSKTNEDFLKEVEDAINELNERKGRRGVCMEMFKEWLIEPIDINFGNLKRAYDDVPSHQKVMLEYVDYKDPLVKLMNEPEPFSEEDRISLLNEYFEGEWTELK
jgi:hypothetical protein